jgi:hypothetical protein
MAGHRAALRLLPGGMGEVNAPVPAAGLTCCVCGMADPPPDPTCSAGPERIDHRVGTRSQVPPLRAAPGGVRPAPVLRVAARGRYNHRAAGTA